MQAGEALLHLLRLLADQRDVEHASLLQGSAVCATRAAPQVGAQAARGQQQTKRNDGHDQAVKELRRQSGERVGAGPPWRAPPRGQSIFLMVKMMSPSGACTVTFCRTFAPSSALPSGLPAEMRPSPGRASAEPTIW